MSDYTLLNRVTELTIRVNEHEHRTQQIMEYLNLIDIDSFSFYDVYKMIYHIRKGGGWL